MTKAKKKSPLLKEQTIVLIKPDGVKRGLIGKVLTRFEESGLKIVALKMVWIDKEMAQKHYPDSRTELLTGIGKKTLETYEKYGRDTEEELGTKDPLEIGRMVNKWNIEFVTEGPVVAILLEGLHAIDNVRMIAGNTLPTFAEPGTVRGDYSVDSPALANAEQRAVRNIMHASGIPEEAKYEKQLWFHNDEIQEYEVAAHTAMFKS